MKGSFSWLVSELSRPKDASILAFTRIAFGILMAIDIPQERGMNHADIKYGEDSGLVCKFPLFHNLHPLSQDWMTFLYTVLFLSAIGIAVGFMYRLNCALFTSIYWYFFFLDKTTWNNHSYLYGLLAFLFLVTDAHRYASIDGLLRKSLQNTHVPQWNYVLFRFQIFLVYFYAGLKKTDLDWLSGYSMGRLSRHWVFDPMRLFMSEAMMDLVVVHIGGFLLDISAGFLLFFDKTRWIGFIFCSSFHFMNSQMFNIGMFPYAMLATMFIFCHSNSFKTFVGKLPCGFNMLSLSPAKLNSNCIYEKISKPSWKHYVAAVLTILYITEQLFLPYSHSITKGYNGWTEGPYGYSWDMMVHSFQNQHIKISYKDKEGKEGFIKPGAFLKSRRSRWSAHPDMTIQYACCLKYQLVKMGIENPSIYIDVWKSLNSRFQQRMYNPNVDLANYKWSPFTHPNFTLPVLSELSNWRQKLKELKKLHRNETQNIVFVADFPGMHLENFVQEDFGNTTISVLRGKVLVEVDSGRNVSLSVGETLKVPPGVFHKVHTISNITSCYFYVYINSTDVSLNDKLNSYAKEQTVTPVPDPLQKSTAVNEDPFIVELNQQQEARKIVQHGSKYRPFAQRAARFMHKKFMTFRRSFLLSYYSCRNLIFGKPNTEQLATEREYLDLWLTMSNSSRPSEHSQDQRNAKREL
uniref:Vitamin K-dependent gamma-carboxylase n=1 Tax=Ciona intestinalis TaxID=7719 RepID=Q008V9_CIOIN|nr:gamma-glutamyl carboxylase [Ciona intestinalis]